MTTPIEPLDFSGMIPTEFATQIIERATMQSIALQLGNRVPMGTRVAEMPVPRAFPKAAWVTADNPRKPYTDMKLGVESITAEEVAAVVAIPDAMIEDLDINIWAWVRPRLAEAIALALDAAVLFGVDAPASFPAGGVAGHAILVPDSTDVVATINDAMSAVERQGVPVTGHAADLAVKGALRGVRDDSGGLLLGTNQVGAQQINTLFGLPIAYQSFLEPTPDFFTGNWDALIIGVRQDIRYELNRAAVLADDQGRVVISGFQDNMTPLKVWARFGCAIVEPVTPRAPDGADPFACVSRLAPTGATVAKAQQPSQSKTSQRTTARGGKQAEAANA